MRATLVLIVLSVLAGCTNSVSPQVIEAKQEGAEVKPVLLIWKMCRREIMNDPRFASITHHPATDAVPTPDEATDISELSRARFACDQAAIKDLSAAYPAIVPAFVSLRTTQSARAKALATGQMTWAEARQQAQDDGPTFKANLHALATAHVAELRQGDAEWQQEQAAQSAERVANSLALMQLGAQLIQSNQPQPVVPPVVNTYCQRFGNTITCQTR